MAEDRCPHCSGEIVPTMRKCPHCGKTLGPSGRELLARPAGDARKSASAGFILRKVIWIAALIVMGFFAIDGFVSFYLQTGAPQQAAAAASACFHMITPYVMARALDELTRGERLRVELD